MSNKKQTEFDEKIERQNKAIISFIWNVFISFATALFTVWLCTR